MATMTMQTTSENSDAPRRTMRRYMLLSLIVIICMMPVVIIILQASGYAGTMDDTQLGFNAEIIKSYLALMTAEGLLLFKLGNLMDYLFIISYGTFFYHSARYLTWNYQDGSIPKRVGTIFASIGVLAAVCDGIENVFLFLMTFDPVGFPNWLAIAHSTFATLKFIMMYSSILWLIVAAILKRTILKPK
ncbi:MAG: hypothetical protein ACFFED_14810 [Candidatus Thorarchaeota archaeon]